jgi:hypothetical protein
MELLLLIMALSVASGIRAASRERLPSTKLVVTLLFVATLGYLSLRVI